MQFEQPPMSPCALAPQLSDQIEDHCLGATERVGDPNHPSDKSGVARLSELEDVPDGETRGVILSSFVSIEAMMYSNAGN